MKLKLFLTFDHELPLGGLKTTYEASLFEPTRKLMNLANKLDVKITLFTDILCGNRFKEWDYTNFYTPYKDQIHEALKEGHDVQLHIHPHWLTTNYKNGTYLPSTDFGLSDFSNNLEYNGVEGIISKSIDDLNELCISANPAYKCLAYRAGGFNIAPETKRIITALYNQGIRYDSSMARGYYFKSGISKVDFRELPKSSNWIIDPENFHSATDSEGILEVPIATMGKTLFEVPTRFKLKKYAYRAPESHGTMIHEENQKDIKAKMKMLFAARMLTFDNHTLSLEYLMRIIRYNIKKYKSSEVLMLSIISHPKTMGKYSFELMENFVNEIRKQYPEAEFLTFSQLHQTNTSK